MTNEKDVIEIMLEDLKRALAKPKNQRKWGMTIDLEKCIGCHACTTACKNGNMTPPGVLYRQVAEFEFGEYPNTRVVFFPRPCMQCQEPPCTKVCPVNATWLGEDGIVVIDYKKCVGCGYCIVACPYGARARDLGLYYSQEIKKISYELEPFKEYNRFWARTSHFSSPVGNARKCHFCIHRVEAGKLPKCVDSCLGRATYFGDLNDPQSLISKINASALVAFKYKEELGTKPIVTYVVSSNRALARYLAKI